MIEGKKDVMQATMLKEIVTGKAIKLEVEHAACTPFLSMVHNGSILT